MGGSDSRLVFLYSNYGLPVHGNGDQDGGSRYSDGTHGNRNNPFVGGSASPTKSAAILRLVGAINASIFYCYIVIADMALFGII